MSSQKSFLKFWSIEQSKSVTGLSTAPPPSKHSNPTSRHEHSQQQPINTTPDASKNQQRKSYLIYELAQCQWRSASSLVAILEEIRLHQLSPVENCQAVGDILFILQRTRRSKQLVRTVVGALQGLLQDQCEGLAFTEAMETTDNYFGASHEQLSRALVSILLHDTMDCGSGRLLQATLVCLRCLVTHGFSARHIGIRPLLICMTRNRDDLYVTIEATHLLKELLIHGADPEIAVQEGGVALLCRIFASTERSKTTVVLETLLLIVTSNPMGREALHKTPRLQNNLARLLSLVSRSNDHVALSSSLRLIAVIIHGRADLKHVVIQSKHLPSIGRLLEPDDSTHLRDDILRVISYLVHSNETPLAPLVPFVWQLLEIATNKPGCHSGRVACCVLTELSAVCPETREVILRHGNGLSGLESIFPGDEGKPLYSVLAKHIAQEQVEVTRKK